MAPGESTQPRQEKLAAIIWDRLQLDEEWFPITNRPALFDKVKDWRAFESAFKRVAKLGCRGNALLTCLSRYDTYNTQNVVLQSASYDADGELKTKAKTRPEHIERPPGKDERESIQGILTAARGKIIRYHTLLFELGQFTDPPVLLSPKLSADDAIAYLPRLLSWCTKLLSEKSLGNFRTVETVGRLVPVVYVQSLMLAKKSDDTRSEKTFFGPVADLIYEINSDDGCSQAELREALRRFQRKYTRVYDQLKRKLGILHNSAADEPDNWGQLFADERKRRMQLKSKSTT